jgi:hypothetical protein
LGISPFDQKKVVEKCAPDFPRCQHHVTPFALCWSPWSIDFATQVRPSSFSSFSFEPTFTSKLAPKMPEQTLKQGIMNDQIDSSIASAEPFKEGKLELNLSGEDDEPLKCMQSMLVRNTWDSSKDSLFGSTGDYHDSDKAKPGIDLPEMLHQNNSRSSPNERLDQSLTGELLRSWSSNKENDEDITEVAAISTRHMEHTVTENACPQRRLQTNLTVEIPSHLKSPILAEGHDSCSTTDSDESILPHTTGMMFLGTDEIGELQLEPFSDDESDCDDNAKRKAPSSREYIRQSITTITSPRCSPTGIEQERQLAFFWATGNNWKSDFGQNNVYKGVDEPTKLMSCIRLVRHQTSALTPHNSRNEDQSDLQGRTKNRPSSAKMLSRLRLSSDKVTPRTPQCSRKDDQLNSQEATTAGLYQQRSNGSKDWPKVVWSYRRSQREPELPNNIVFGFSDPGLPMGYALDNEDEGNPGTLDVYVDLPRDSSNAALEQESQFVFQDEICIDYGNGLAEC